MDLDIDALAVAPGGTIAAEHAVGRMQLAFMTARSTPSSWRFSVRSGGRSTPMGGSTRARRCDSARIKEDLMADRVALVTGGGRGIGRAVALGLAADGIDVAITYRRDSEAAAETVAGIEANGRAGLAIQADVSVPDDNVRTVTEVLDRFGRFDIVISNGGVASGGRPVVATEPKELLRVVSTHALGPHHLMSIAVPHLRMHDRADIVVISSVATIGNNANGAPYNMGKAALEALALTLAKEERDHGIRVNIVAPGLVETEMGRRLVKGAAGIDDITTLNAIMPFGRLCQPEDIAAAVRFFVSDSASYVTGEKLNVWGGGQQWR
jgi:NAD(P)-dependent dehydrogenase (short-subunit alcohol dehydrogenase family)